MQRGGGMRANAPLKNLYLQLQSAGISPAFARKVLPDWWDDSIATSASGLQQAQLYFSKVFNLDFASLASQENTPRFRPVVHKFKMNQNVVEDDIRASAHYCTAMAKLAVLASPLPYSAPSENPSQLREQILADNECVDLTALLSWCKGAGIPVLHINDVPGKKMTALAICLGGRFAVVLSRKGHPSELLFHLAHELGHIAKGHLNSDGFLADQQMGDSFRGDADELEADAYAIRLINGTDAKYHTSGQSVNGNMLYAAALAKSKSERIDVGHIILNYGHAQRQFALAKTALKLVPGPENGSAVVNGIFFDNLDNERLSDDQLAQLHTATGYISP